MCNIVCVCFDVYIICVYMWCAKRYSCMEGTSIFCVSHRIPVHVCTTRNKVYKKERKQHIIIFLSWITATHSPLRCTFMCTHTLIFILFIYKDTSTFCRKRYQWCASVYVCASVRSPKENPSSSPSVSLVAWWCGFEAPPGGWRGPRRNEFRVKMAAWVIHRIEFVASYRGSRRGGLILYVYLYTFRVLVYVCIICTFATILYFNFF